MENHGRGRGRGRLPVVMKLNKRVMGEGVVGR